MQFSVCGIDGKELKLKEREKLLLFKKHALVIINFVPTYAIELLKLLPFTSKGTFILMIDVFKPV